MRTSPAFESLSRFSSALSNLCNRRRSTEVNYAAKLLLAMDDFSEAISVLFPREKDNVLYNMEIIGNRESLQTVISMLSKLLDGSTVAKAVQGEARCP